MGKIQIKNRFANDLIFEHEVEDNTIKITLLAAVAAKADLREADLRGVNLSGANLSGADLSGADLSGADLRRTNLCVADLRMADLRRADLRMADLRRADLRRANLCMADLRRADLRRADLRMADLRGVDGESVKVKNLISFVNLYIYEVHAFITEDGREIIKMGCYTRLLSDWEKDFWNNPKEFPNDGSVKSELRKAAFEMAKRWIELHRDNG